ncbi:MAG: hypothetical protein ACYC44_00260 [Patescibacteria group bacterium]
MLEAVTDGKEEAMGYRNSLFFHGCAAKVEPGDKLIVFLEDAAVSFMRGKELMDINLGKGTTDKRCYHFGDPKIIPGMRHTRVASEVSLDVDLRLKIIASYDDRVVYEFSK